MSKYVRKYEKGAKITSLDELVKQDFVYWNDKIWHHGWYLSCQFRMIYWGMLNGRIHYAIRREEDLNGK